MMPTFDWFASWDDKEKKRKEDLSISKEELIHQLDIRKRRASCSLDLGEYLQFDFE